MKLTKILLPVIILSLTFYLITPGPLQAAVPSEVVRSGSGNQKVVALTFDAGSDIGHTAEILDILKERKVKATFFLTGQWLQRFPDMARRITAEGHAVGNHSFSHPDFTTIGKEEMKLQLNNTNDLAKQHLGRGLQPFFRPPFGSYSAESLEVLGELGYRWTVMWTVDTLDWKSIPAGQIVDRAMSGVVPGGIILMHVGSGTETPKALPIIIDRIKNSGYGLVSLPEMFSQSVYHTVRPGETLSSIGRIYGVSPQQIAAANNLPNPDIISVGQRLAIPGQVKPGGVKHTVAKGETLWSISRKYGTTVSAIVQMNGLQNNMIYVGQQLIIPQSAVRTYTVQKGDTLWGIAQRHSTTVTAIQKANNLTNPNHIYVGQKLVIPT